MEQMCASAYPAKKSKKTFSDQPKKFFCFFGTQKCRIILKFAGQKEAHICSILAKFQVNRSKNDEVMDKNVFSLVCLFTLSDQPLYEKSQNQWFKDIKLIMPTLLILLFTIFIMVTVIPYAFSSVIKQLNAVQAQEALGDFFQQCINFPTPNHPFLIPYT